MDPAHRLIIQNHAHLYRQIANFIQHQPIFVLIMLVNIFYLKDIVLHLIQIYQLIQLRIRIKSLNQLNLINAQH